MVLIASLPTRPVAQTTTLYLRSGESTGFCIIVCSFAVVLRPGNGDIDVSADAGRCHHGRGFRDASSADQRAHGARA